MTTTTTADRDIRTTTKTGIRATGKCHGCKSPLSALFTRTSTTLTTWGLTGMKSRTRRSYICESRLAAGSTSQTVTKCGHCGILAHLTPIDGTRTETPCDHRCTDATGHKCECSCGGANHGAAHTVAA